MTVPVSSPGEGGRTVDGAVIYFDTEFIEDGRTIELISIGLVRDDGATYYAVSADMPIRRIRKHDWLMENVVPGLPKVYGDARNYMPRRWLFNYAAPEVKPRSVIASEIVAFAGPSPEFWAWYADYDWVVLCQLFGTMLDLPDGWPMFCRDLRQVTDGSTLPPQTDADGPEHNALADARWLARAAAAVRVVAAPTQED